MELTEILKPLAGTPQTTTALVVLLLPLLAFFVLFSFGKRLPRHGDWLAIGISAITFALSVYLFTQTWNTASYHIRTVWFSLPSSIISDFTAGILLDNLTVLMLVIVTFISTLVQLFSVGYMHGDEGYNRYFAYLGLFTFSMLGIVLVDNLLLLFIFWELVGFSSYLLIGFWFERPAAVAANKKAFLVNRVGDIGLLLGLFAFYTYFRTFDLETLRTLISTGNWANNNFIVSYTLNGEPWLLELSPLLLTLAGLGLFMGCVGKSAQFPLQIWLPDAMQGPTPVSSLIHAATMVAAGVYLLARCYAFFTPDALTVIAIVGAITALLGALAALTQYDIKAVLAFSTISQLGYMVMGMGTGAYDASLFHLTTHAFFKAALFLNAGIIIHAMHRGLYHIHQPATTTDPQDIRNMGGLRKAMPITFYTYLLAAAALVGLPLFSGFLSKDAILSGSWAWAQTMSMNGNSLYFIVPVIGFAVVLLTAFYMARHMWYMFFGGFRLPFNVQQVRFSAEKENELVMVFPVVLLAILSLGIFFSLNPLNFSSSWVMNGLSINATSEGILLADKLLQTITAQDKANHTAHLVIGVLSAVLGVAGIGLAVSKYKNRTSEALLQAKSTTALARFSYNHFYLDSFFNTTFVKPALWTATTLYRVDKRIIDYTLNYGSKWLVVLSKMVSWFDRLVVDGSVWLVGALSKLFGMLGRNLQNGKVQSYYAYSLFGFILIILYIVLF